MLKEFEERILAFLRGAADGVEDLKIRRADGWAIAIEDRRLEATLDFLGFRLEHGGLVSDANATKMEVWVKALRETAFEAGEKGGTVAAVSDVVTDEFGVGEG